MKFTEEEHTLIVESTKMIATILLSKMDIGFKNPSITGTIDVENENRIVTFEFNALITK